MHHATVDVTWPIASAAWTLGSCAIATRGIPCLTCGAPDPYSSATASVAITCAW